MWLKYSVKFLSILHTFLSGGKETVLCEILTPHMFLTKIFFCYMHNLLVPD